MEFKKSPKIYKGYKADSPENTVKRIENGFKRLGLNIQYFQNSKADNELGIFSSTAQLVNTPFATNGKGLTASLTKASAYAECAERFSAGSQFAFYILEEYLEKNNLIFQDAVKNDSIVKDFIRFSYQNGYTKSDNGHSSDTIPVEKFINTYPITKELTKTINKNESFNHYCDSFSLLENKTVKIPLAFINYIQIHNGLASGNSKEEAILHGCCEVFERYRALQVLKEKEKAPSVDIKSINNDRILSIINTLKKYNIDVVIKDLTKGIYPVMGVLFINNNLKDSDNPIKRHYYHHCFRVASDLDLNEAILRCFTEELQGFSLEEYCNQIELDILWKNWNNNMGNSYIPSGEISFKHYLRQNITNMDLSFLYENCEYIDFSSLVSVYHDDFFDDLEYIKGIFKKINLDVYIVDHTHKIIDFPTVRIVVPKMSDIVGYYVNNQTELNDYFDRNKIIDFFYFDGLSQIIIDESYRTDNNKLKEFVAKAEKHLAECIYDYNLALGRYGLQNVNLFSILSKVFSSLGDVEKMEKYIDFAINIWTFKTNSKNSDNYENQLIEIKKDLKTPISDKNPFINSCNCDHCKQLYPKLIYNLMKSFYL